MKILYYILQQVKQMRKKHETWKRLSILLEIFELISFFPFQFLIGLIGDIFFYPENRYIYLLLWNLPKYSIITFLFSRFYIHIHWLSFVIFKLFQIIYSKIFNKFIRLIFCNLNSFFNRNLLFFVHLKTISKQNK